MAFSIENLVKSMGDSVVLLGLFISVPAAVLTYYFRTRDDMVLNKDRDRRWAVMAAVGFLGASPLLYYAYRRLNPGANDFWKQFEAFMKPVDRGAGFLVRNYR